MTTATITPIPAAQHGEFTPFMLGAIADYVINPHNFESFCKVQAVLALNGANDEQVHQSLAHVNRMIDMLHPAKVSRHGM